MTRSYLAVFPFVFLALGVHVACDRQVADQEPSTPESHATTPSSPDQSPPAAAPTMMRDASNGLVTVRVTDRSVDEAYTALEQAIEANEKLTVMAEFDHTANAKKAELELRPTRVIVFGNPALGSPLMQKSPTMALDLPQRMLVVESGDNQVDIVYNDPSFLARRHGVTGADEGLEKIAGALEKLAGAAAGATPVEQDAQ